MNLKISDKDSFGIFVDEQRDKCGGLIMALIVPENLRDFYPNTKPATVINQTDEFYLYGEANYCYQIYVDKSLKNAFYLIGNLQSIKVTTFE